ncbi:MAG: hypothetical protein WCW40_10345, partial [Bacteroidota bacterium]
RCKECKEDGQNPRRPKQYLFHGCTHAAGTFRFMSFMSHLPYQQRKTILNFLLESYNVTLPFSVPL